MRNIILFTLLVLFSSACASASPITPTATEQTGLRPAVIPDEIILTEDCGLEPITAPALPDTIPAYGEIDPDTGLHMTGEPQVIDFPAYRLKVSGRVDNPLSLTYDQLRCLPKVTDDPLLNCPGYFRDQATWSGASLAALLQLAQPQAGAARIRLISADGYGAEIDLEQAKKEWNFLAYELNGETLPVLQGFPVRAVFPGVGGSDWVKWLVEIEVK